MPQHLYTMPPEWAEHEMTLLAWPDNRETWPGEHINRVEHVYADILEALTPYEKVLLLTANEQAHQAAAAMIQHRNLKRGRVRLVRLPVNDVWIRDYGPVMLIKQGQRPVMSSWEYNAWGGKYLPCDDDNTVPERLAALLGYPLVYPGMVLEGGSVDVNGAGCLLTTESVLLNPNRNPGLGKTDIEEQLKRWLGVEKIIWLKKGLKGDDTDGHIDDLARFVSERVIVAAVSRDHADPNHDVLMENMEILRRASDIHGRPFEIIELPLPMTRIQGTTVDGSEFVPASYANFYIANGCVLLPLYDSRYDNEVLERFRGLFPGRRIQGIPCNDLVWGQGSIHCVTQQILR